MATKGTVVALLRGVNVGGVRFAMRDLAAALQGAGYEDVRTILASGNVVLRTTQTPTDVASGVHAVIEDRFGFDVAVIAVAMADIAEAVEGYPFERTPNRHAYAVFAQSRVAITELAEAAGTLDPSLEVIAHGGHVLYWDVPKRHTLDSKFGREYGRWQKTGAVTTRNLQTLEKILAAAPA